MSKVLVKYRSNWADEMDVEGFKIYNSEKEFKDELKKFLLENQTELSEEEIKELIEDAKTDWNENYEYYKDEGYATFDIFLEEFILDCGECSNFEGKYYHDNFEIYIGTNESINYASIDSFLEDFECSKISEEVANEIGTKFGVFPL